MINFYIKSITATGKGKTDSTIEFIDGVNIIRGDSDTGKSKIIKSILFAMGASHKPFAKKTGYDKVLLVIGTPNGDISFSRKYSANLIDVSSENADIEDGTYSTKYNTDRTPINQVWMQLMGIDGQPMVGANLRSDKKRLTWNNLMRLFYLDEQEICRETSIIEPVQYTERTLLLSSILYLIYGKDFSSDVTKEEAGLKKQKQQAVEDYIQEKINSCSGQIERLAAYYDAFKEMQTKRDMQQILDEIRKLESDITGAAETSQKLLDNILQTEEAIAGCNMLLDRYGVLETQYRSDIKRLSFMTDGEKIFSEQVEQCTCPYCLSKISIEQHPSIRETADAEAKKNSVLLGGLAKTMDGVKSDREVNLERLEGYRKERLQIDQLIKEQLMPKKEELENLLQEYQEQIKHKTMKETLDEQRAQWIRDLEDVKKKDISEPEDYHPKDHFTAECRRVLDELAMEILQKVKFPGLISARFNINTFDIEVNGGTKIDDHGKGYCAFLNSVVALMFRKYLVDHAEYMPGITMIDSPLHGMFQGVEDDAPESMKTGIFSYMCSLGGEGQLIIAENGEHVPELDYSTLGVREIVFSKTIPGMRHGFLLDVYQ